MRSPPPPEPPPSQRLPSLRDLAIRAAAQNTHRLGDVGLLPADAVRAILAAATPAEIATVEDETLAGSGSDLSLITWHLWRRGCAAVGFDAAVLERFPARKLPRSRSAGGMPGP